MNFAPKKPCPDYGMFGVYKKFSKVVLEQTAFCPGKCVFCIYKNRADKGTMSLADLEFALSRLPEQRGLVYLCGNGEALTLDDLPTRIAMVKRAWPQSLISLLSTLNVARPRDYFAQLIEAGLEHVDVSCYGHSRKDYSHLHGVDALNIVVTNMEHLAAFRSRYQLLLHLHLLNDTGVHFGIKLADHKKVQFRRDAQQNGYEIRDTELRRRSSATEPMPYPCPVAWAGLGGELHITWNLDVAPCGLRYAPQHSLGNLREVASLQEIFNGTRYTTFLAELWENNFPQAHPCYGCEYPLHTASPHELARLAAYQGTRLAGKNVYFYYADPLTYENTKFFFSSAKPLGIIPPLFGKPESPARRGGLPIVDGIPVLERHDLREAEPLPVLIFADPAGNLDAISDARSLCPWLVRQNIILAQAKTIDWIA
ncbi:SPASM domain-containing protein [Desulfovibrio sp. OttesenSCG-928-M14]|nr:SPASM domain-containing protein [Desulfovibrio sp. OttesenSCG-928-M14]